MSNPVSVIFAGLTPSPIREFAAAQLDPDLHTRVLLPCVGRWSVATALAERIPAERIEASDIALFSSVIGYLADPRHELDELGVVIPDEVARFGEKVATEFDRGAAILMALKYLQTPPKNTYLIELRNEMWTNAHAMRDALAAGLEQQVGLLAGCKYDLADVRDVVKDAVESGPETFLYTGPPVYKKGYTKMFEGGEEQLWTCLLTTSEFDPSETQDMLDSMTGRPVLAVAHLLQGDSQLPPDWVKLAGIAVTATRTDYVVANRDTGNRLTHSAKSGHADAKWPIYNEQEITPDSEISFVRVDKHTCLHYRDLFVHRLGRGSAEVYYLMLIDGRVTSAFGLITRDVQLGKTGYMGEPFGISVGSQRYARLAKLFQLAITSDEFRDFLLVDQPNLQAYEMEGIQTSTLSLEREGKAERGVMKLVHREKKKGFYRLVYRGKFRDETFQQVLEKWHRAHAHVARDSWTGPRLDPPAPPRKRKKGRGGAAREH